MKKVEDEYTDYSCSTNLERLARDVETLLRSWHIVEGSDRHVSFHRDNDSTMYNNVQQKSYRSGLAAGNNGNSKQEHNRNNSADTNKPSARRRKFTLKNKSGININDHVGSPMKEAKISTTEHDCEKKANQQHSPTFHTPGRTPSRTEDERNTENKEGSINNQNHNDIQLIRSSKLFFTTVPLHTDAHSDKKMQIELELCLWDGPPTVFKEEANSSSSAEASSSLMNTIKKQKRNLPLSLVSNRQVTSSSLTNSNLLSNLSNLLGIGQHITLTPISQGIINSCIQSTVDTLLMSQLPSRWNRPQPSILPSNNRTVEQEVELYTTALHSLSNQLQMALNIATSACDCRIPAFGIWGLYRNSVLHSSNKQYEINPEILNLSHSLIDVPTWMNVGNLFNLTSKSSSIGAFLHYVEDMCHEGENESSNVDGSLQHENSNNDNSNTSPLRRQRPKMNLSSPKRSLSRSTSNSSQQLYLPAMINGNCHPGPSLFGIGATFAIHVVPPGVDYPIHCTTLNSLGYLLLQHCPSTSLSKRQYDSKSWSKLSSIEDRDVQGKIIVVGARHKYTWSNIFQYNEDYIPRQDDLLLSPLSSFRYRDSWYNFNILTYGLQWRRSSEIDYEFHTNLTDNDNDNDHEALNAVLLYRRKCREYAMKLLYRVSCLAKSQKTQRMCVSKKSLEPFWGPTSDPIAMISATVTWKGGEGNEKNHNHESLIKSVPLLTLPLRIRSQKTMSSQDILEMENTILSTIFNPLSVPQSDFVVNISLDSDAACTTLSASNRCLLASLIRTCTLESDTLIAHITKSTILEKLHDRPELDFVAEEIMDKAALSPVTRKLVEVLDWGSMADMLDDEAWGNEDRFERIIDQILQSPEFPSPPDVLFAPSHFVISDLSDAESAYQSFAQKASPHGRLLSVLFTSLASLQTPSSISALWMSFVSALRLRWEQRERLNNLHHVPGIDDMIPSGTFRPRAKKNHSTHGLGRIAKNAAFINSTESDPNLSECLISQKLQVFNIGVEAVIATEMRKLEKTVDIQPLPQSISNNQHSSLEVNLKITLQDDSDSCDFRSCGTREEDDLDDNNDISCSDNIISISSSPLREGTAHTPTRRGARCPVEGLNLSSTGDQIYAPYLQREVPLTDDLIIERRKMIADNRSNSIENRIEIAIRLQKPKLLADMCAFKAANPNAVFHDFTRWYGNPENSLEMYDDDLFLASEFPLSQGKMYQDEMNEAILVLNATRSLWTDCWDESQPIPADEQKPLFDPFTTVEMLLLR